MHIILHAKHIATLERQASKSVDVLPGLCAVQAPIATKTLTSAARRRPPPPAAPSGPAGCERPRCTWCICMHENGCAKSANEKAHAHVTALRARAEIPTT